MCKVVRMHIKEVFLKEIMPGVNISQKILRSSKFFWKIVKTDPCGFGENLWMTFFMYCGLFLLNISYHMNLQWNYYV